MLLGYTAQSAVGNLPTEVSNSVRDSAIDFINAPVSPSSDSKSRELCDHILDALLVGLEKAFLWVYFIWNFFSWIFIFQMHLKKSKWQRIFFLPLAM